MHGAKTDNEPSGLNLGKHLSSSQWKRNSLPAKCETRIDLPSTKKAPPEWLPAIAAMLGTKPPLHVPAWVARFLVGEHLVVMIAESRAGSNAKAKRELDWRPRHPSWRQGIAEIIQQQTRLGLRQSYAAAKPIGIG